MFRIASLLFPVYTVSLLLSLSLPLSIHSQTHGANVECTPSCGNINILSPFRLQGDPGDCGNKNYELSCEENETSQSHHAVLYLFSGKYYVKAINYNNATIRLVDAGVHKIKDNYFSDPVYPLTRFNFSDDPYRFMYRSNPVYPLTRLNFSDDPYTIYYEYFESPYSSWKYLTVPLVFLSCTNPMNLSDLFVETAPCIGSHSSSDSSLSTVYSYFMLGRLDKYGYPDMSPADVGLSCTITYGVPPPAPTDKYSKSCEGIYKHLAYGFELSWLDQECTEKCGPEETCVVNHNNTGIDSIECERKGHKLEGSIIKILCFCTLSILPIGIGTMIYSSNKREENQLRVKRFLEDYRALKPSRYSYADIKRITDQFKEKLGQGAYGTVFKGKLSSELLVAVKILNNSNEKGEDFINEVGTMGQIHHVNVVRLVGYCADGFRRALVYEFLPNGPLPNFLSSADNENSFLGWDRLQDIALGIAKGIEYLHQGCEQQILHFDIKPHNVLLDHDFTPKVSDFGLAKLFSKDQSAVSMTAVRGTVGYIAPEVFSRNFGNVSYKSDVYSYGILLLEMVGGRKNFKVMEDSTSQVYFPEWIYNLLEQGSDLRIHIGDEANVKIARKLAIVGLWCIQWHPMDRPSMKTVVQMLEREGDNLTMPPNPFASASSSNE